MPYLLLASLLWAFSFGMIKKYLSELDPFFVAWARLAVSFAVFAPFCRPRGLPGGMLLRLAGVGAVQYGLMYICYIASYRTLSGHQVALFTILTPLYVVWLHDARTRRFHGRDLLAAALAVAGAAVIVYSGRDWRGRLAGFALVQISNLAFAFGQLAYRAVLGRVVQADNAKALREELNVFGILYLGGLLAASVPAALATDWGALRLTGTQAGMLLYLGLLPSGLAFFLWNAGARRTEAGTLAVFNNAKIPLAVLAALLFFGEPANLPAVLAGGGLMAAALLVCARR